MKKFLKLLDNKGFKVQATIERIDRIEMPLKKDGWEFNWKVFSTESKKDFFALKTAEGIQGVICLEKVNPDNDEMMYMHLIEIAPHNRGKNGKYMGAAGCLLAFACYVSILDIEQGRSYAGFVVFESKTNLVNVYHDYGAKIAVGTRMYFDPDAGNKLIEEYLND